MSERKLVCYISGPMTGIEDHNFPAFFAVEESLQKSNLYTVLNPARHPPGLAYEQYMAIDMAMVGVADCLCLLPGWENSKGSVREYEAFIHRMKTNKSLFFFYSELVPHASKIKPTAPDILDKAVGHMRDRASTYDKPEGERSMGKTVEVFNAFHGTSLTEAQGWHFMQVLKDVRLFTRDTYHADSAEDSVAYAGLKAEAKAAGR